MSPFTKGFTVALLLQLAVLVLVAIAFFAGGPAANPIRALIALAGMALLMVIGLLGIKSLSGVAAAVLALMCLVASIAGLIKAALSTGADNGA